MSKTTKKKLTPQQLKARAKERASQRATLAKQAGLMGAGIVGGVFLPGRIAAPAGVLLTILSLVGKPKPELMAVGLPMLGGVAADLFFTGGTHMRTAQPSLKDEFKQGGARTKNYFRALAHGLWLDKVFKPKTAANAAAEADVDLSPLLEVSTTESPVSGFLGTPGYHTLDQLEGDFLRQASAPGADHAPVPTARVDHI